MNIQNFNLNNNNRINNIIRVVLEFINEINNNIEYYNHDDILTIRPCIICHNIYIIRGVDGGLCNLCELNMD